MRTIGEIETEVELGGAARGTELFDIRVREGKVRLCQERRGVAKCKLCPHYADCELVKAHLIDVTYRLPALKKELGDAQDQQDRKNPWLHLGMGER